MKYVIRIRSGYVVGYDDKDNVEYVLSVKGARLFDSILDANNFRSGSDQLMLRWSIIQDVDTAFKNAERNGTPARGMLSL